MNPNIGRRFVHTKDVSKKLLFSDKTSSRTVVVCVLVLSGVP